MADLIQHTLFKKSSTTYFYSSIFFPEDVKKDIWSLYSFVRTADDFVDTIPQKRTDFFAFKSDYHKGLKTGNSDNPIIQSFLHTMHKRRLLPQWIDAFFDAMQQDLNKTTYQTIAELGSYMYGSAEIIGLCMARIMELPSNTHPAAQMLGKAMQYINFIRDIAEDNGLGRTYIPQEELNAYQLNSLTVEEIKKKPDQFHRCIRAQIARYEQWQAFAEKGFAAIPRTFRIPIQTASDMYRYTASVINKNPHVIFEKKVKPHRLRVLLRACYYMIWL